MSENSVGSISLDLVIQNNTAEQLEKIQNQVERPAKKIGDSIESAVNRPLKSTTENLARRVDSAMEKIRKTLENTDISVNPAERFVDGLEKIQDKIELVQVRWNKCEFSSKIQKS